jgi:hypothetical protein
LYTVYIDFTATPFIMWVYIYDTRLQIMWYSSLQLNYLLLIIDDNKCCVQMYIFLLRLGLRHCVTSMPPRVFDVHSGPYDRPYEIKKYFFAERTCGRMSIQSFNNFLPCIPFFENCSKGRPL